jgi:hypothetical protein
MTPYLREAFDHVAAIDPVLASRLAIHETGSPVFRPNGFRTILFLLQDPLTEDRESCYAEAYRIAGEARSNGMRLLNPPDTLAEHCKSRTARLWRKAGLPTPESYPCGTVAELRDVARRIGGPVILRPEHGHSQIGVRYFAGFAEVDSFSDEGVSMPGIVSRMVDTRGSYRKTKPGSVFAEYYHRAISLSLEVCCSQVIQWWAPATRPSEKKGGVEGR